MHSFIYRFFPSLQAQRRALLGLRRLYLLNLGALLQRRARLTGDVQVINETISSSMINPMCCQTPAQHRTCPCRIFSIINAPALNRDSQMLPGIILGPILPSRPLLQGSVASERGLNVDLDNLQALVTNTNDLADTLRAVCEVLRTL